MKRLGIILLSASAMLAARSQFVINFEADDLRFSKVSEYDVVTLLDLPTITEVGMPGLPVKTMHVALTPGQRAVGVKIIEVETETLSGTYRLLPVQPPRKTSVKENKILGPSEKYYSRSIYPEKIAEIAGNGDIAGQPLCAVRIYPLAYIPQSGMLILRKRIVIEIETESAQPPKGIKLTPLTRPIYERELKELVANPEDVTLRSAAPTGTKLDPGDYEYVIITTSSLQSYWSQLLNWKKRKGVNDTIVNVTWIYNNYSGSDNQEKIRNFVIDANSTWGTVWFLIGADADQIPMKVKQFYVDDWYDVPSDYYYADYDDDWYQEVFVARAPVDNYNQINIFVGKVLKYEKDPPVTNYPLEVLLIGMDLDGSTQSENVKIAIDNYYIPSRFNVNRVYDSYGGNHKDSVVYYLNQGQNLVNHSDHSDWYVLGVGYTNHNWSLYSSDIDALSNTYKTCIFYSLGCWSNAFDYSDAISEHFIVYNSNRAGVAYIGNTRYGWYNPGNYNTLSMKYDREWWKSLFNYDKYILGQTLADSRNRNYPSDDADRYVSYELCILGDPEMPIWTDTPQELTVSHPDTIAAYPGNYTVVVYSGGAPVESAYVCLYKDGEVYERGYTNSSGQATFYINPTSEGTMYVTVTKHNYIPYQGESYVTSGPPVADFTANPTSGVTPLTVQFTDLSTGYITSWHWFFGDGEESYEQNPTHVYTYEGSFDVTLIVSGPAGADTMTKSDYINIVCDNVMVFDTVMAYPGGHFKIQLLAKTAMLTQAFQIGVCFDPDYIQIDSVNYTNTVLDTAWGGTGPDYINPYIDNDTGNLQAACVFDMVPPLEKQLAPMNYEPILNVYCTMSGSVTPPDTTYITLSNDCGLNIFTDTVPQSIHPCIFESPIAIVEEPLFIRGDANIDGSIDISDVTYILNHLFPSPTFSCLDAADCDDNGNVDITDATYLLDHIFPSPSLPAPCPNCGVDPTSDGLNCESYPPCGTMLNVAPPTMKGNKAYLKFDLEEKKADVSIEIMNTEDVVAFQFQINYSGATFKNYEFTDEVKNFGVLDAYIEDGLIVLYGIYGLTPYSSGMPVLKPGHHEIARLTFTGDPNDIEMEKAVIATPDGINLNPAVSYVFDNEPQKSRFALFNAVPNPADKTVKLGFETPQKGKVTLTIYNAAGQKITRLIDGTLDAGEHSVQWNFKNDFGREVADGIYFYELQWNEKRAIKKFIIKR